MTDKIKQILILHRIKEIIRDVEITGGAKEVVKIIPKGTPVEEVADQILKELREDIKQEVKKMIEEEMNHNSGDWSCEICKKRDVILKKLENL